MLLESDWQFIVEDVQLLFFTITFIFNQRGSVHLLVHHISKGILCMIKLNWQTESYLNQTYYLKWLYFIIIIAPFFIFKCSQG